MSKITNQLLFCFLLSFCGMQGQAIQKEMDSLMKVAEKSNDSVQLRIHNRVAFYYIFNNKKKAQEILKHGVLKSQNVHQTFNEAELTNTYGILMDVSGKRDSANYYFTKAYHLSKLNNYPTIEVMVVNNLGMFNWNLGNYKEALNYFFEALELGKTVEKSKAKPAVYFNNIGLIYQDMGLFDKALVYHNKALALRREFKLEKDISTSLNNIAVIQSAKGKYDKAIQTANESLIHAKNANSMGLYYGALAILSNAYLKEGNYNKAISLKKEIIEGRNKLDIERYMNIGVYADLMYAYNNNNEFSESRKCIVFGEKLIQEFPEIKTSLVDFYRSAAETNYIIGNIAEGNEYLTKAFTVNDSIFSSENASSIANMEVKYKTAEKEADLAKTRANLAESELKIKKHNILMYGSISLAILLGLIGYLVYKQQKLKNIQLQKENQLKISLAHVETKNKLQEQRLRISRDLHDNIGAQLTFVISSLRNLTYKFAGKNDETSLKIKEISNFAVFAINELRDTVWAMNKETISLDDLYSRISNLLENARKSAEGITFSLKSEKELTGKYTFTSLEGINIYRIVQESVNNAVKYANAQKIEVSIGQIDKGLLLRITDNGKGFDVENVEKGNGLINMEKRIKEIKAQLEITSQLQKGTEISLRFS